MVFQTWGASCVGRIHGDWEMSFRQAMEAIGALGECSLSS